MVEEEVPEVDSEFIAELTTNITQMMQALYSAGSVTDTLLQVVELSVATIDGCDFAGVFVVDDDAVTTPVSTDPIVIELDAIQHRTGEGPCLDAIAIGSPFYADDLSDGTHWPRFGPEAAAQGVRSLLGLPLTVNGTASALNLYGRYPDSFGVIDRGKAVLLARMADLAISSAQTHENEERRNISLQAALATREIIGQAQGILMERERISAAGAFDVLRRASQHLNVKLRVVAQDLVDTGERPDTGSRPT